MDASIVLEITFMIILLLLTRVLYLIHKITTGYSRKSGEKRSKCSAIICIGSGGHTTEMLQLIRNLDFDKYNPRYYVMAKTDKCSRDKVEKFEQLRNKQQDYSIIEVPRSREVQQSYFTSVITTMYSILCSIPIVLKTMPDLIICNGPGSCVPICIVSFILKCMFIKDIRIVFVESYCRVHTFSLTGKILTYLADNFLVQWPELKIKMKRSEYIGQLL
ncbi:hypothetical protein WA026_002515 [Henosepilachna vigintioctopunctata]|uniref:UDP-N-acetylglucosamine transferase subunit ALG14 n=1 Tax=Henosepilachna vigintioctopunctata TaxID=420089 RepID=A0AAW1TTP5_9CUCU